MDFSRDFMIVHEKLTKEKVSLKKIYTSPTGMQLSIKKIKS